MKSQQRYISNELTHFIGGELKKETKAEQKQYEVLCKILKERKLRGKQTSARTTSGISWSWNLKAQPSQNDMVNTDMVCFCDIPILDLEIHIKKYGPFALALDKDFIVKKGGSPVYYVAKKSLVRGGLPERSDDTFSKEDYFDIFLPKFFSRLHGPAVEGLNDGKLSEDLGIFMFVLSQFFSYLKFFDHKLKEGDPQNYYFEREWRVLGEVTFKMRDIKRILIPESFSERFRKDFPKYYGQLTFTT